MDGLKQDKSEWVKHVKHIVNKYNNTLHSTIEIKPVEAVKTENHLCVNLYLQNSSKTKTGNILSSMKVVWLELILKQRSLLKVMNRIGVQRGITLLV